jgi:signal transduction histidine kinase
MGVLVTVDAAWAAQRQVLVIYSTRRDAQVAIRGDRDLPRILEAGLEEGLDFYSEYIDLGRLANPGYADAFSDFLRLKYQGQRFDLVIAIQDVAVDFVSRRRDELFPETPLVFVATPEPAAGIKNSTGLTIPLRLADTLTLAVALQPDLQNVFVVSGADARDQVYERLARAQLRSFEPRLTITFLAGLPTDQLETRLAALPQHSAVYYLVVNRDGTGASFHPLEYLDRLAAVANAPMYSWVDSTLEHGILGGALKNLAAQTEAVGSLALRVLRGERADSIPVSAPNLNVNEVDWRQMRRWGISEARVPAGTRILFKEPSVWDRYKIYILGASAILLAQTGLIVGLLVQARRRRRAEKEVRRAQDELRTSYERIHDLGSRLLTAQDEERSRIARELHDDISQQIVLLALDLQFLRDAVQPDCQKLAGEAVNRAQDVVRSVHDLSHRLHPSKLRLIGLMSAIQGLQRELSRPGMSITFTHDHVPSVIPSDLKLCLFRIVQEAVQNALSHSKAREITIHLSGVRDGLALTIADDGVGFDVDAVRGKGLGLVSISERLEAIGGTLKVVSGPGAGTRLSITVPLSVADRAEAETR